MIQSIANMTGKSSFEMPIASYMSQDKDKSHKKPAARKRPHKDTSRARQGAPDQKAAVSVCRFLVGLATMTHFLSGTTSK